MCVCVCVCVSGCVKAEPQGMEREVVVSDSERLHVQEVDGHIACPAEPREETVIASSRSA